MTAIAARSTRIAGAAADGVRDVFPAAVGVLPFATMIGVAVGASPMSDFGGWLSGLIIAGGSAHLAIASSITVGAGFLATVATALAINARSLIYGALLAPSMRTQPRWFKWFVAYSLVDQIYALVAGVAHRDDGYVRRYHVAAMSTLWTGYMIGVGLGVAVGPVIPSAIPLSLSIPIIFLAMVIPSVTDRPAGVAAVVAMVAAVAGTALPAGIGMLGAIIAGTAAGSIAERWS